MYAGAFVFEDHESVGAGGSTVQLSVDAGGGAVFREDAI